MGLERRAYGPPGTGKTYWINRQVERLCSKYDPSEIGIMSFTKAGALEAASRILLPKRNIGTIHSMCYQLMDKEPLADKKLKEWTDAAYPMKGSLGDRDEPTFNNRNEFSGDRALRELNMCINTCQPVPAYLHEFQRLWDDWKRETGYIDYTDMLLQGFESERPFPECKVLFVDEAQDLSPLQAKLIRHWGIDLDQHIFVGDDDQCIYEFAGATPDTLIENLDPETTLYLQNGFRVPTQIYDYAQNIIRRVQKRVEKTYTPVEADSNILFPPQHPETIVSMMEQDAGNGTVMLLASAGYQLNPYLAVMKKNGIPFHNPYRVDRGDWNPLPARSTRTISTAQRVNRFLTGELLNMTWNDLWAWAEMLADTAFAIKGGKARIKKERAENPGGIVDSGALYALFGFDLERIESHDPMWLMRHARVERCKSIEYACRIVYKGGVESLSKAPKITAGTIHSVKGGESDFVYILAQLPVQFRQLQMGRHVDQLYRLFYVACTRARKGLRIVGHNGIL